MEPKQRILEELRRRQLLEKQRRQREKYKIGNRIQTVGNIVKKLPDAINKTQDTINKIKSFRSTPSILTPENTTNALTDTLKSSTSMNNLPNSISNTTAVPKTLDINTVNSVDDIMNTANTAKTAQTASNIANTAGNASKIAGAISKAAPVVGAVAGGASAVNNFAKGNHVDGALDIAKTGAMFIPGVGWAISGAIQIGQMIKDAINKKKQQEQQKNLQRMAETNALAEQKKQETIAQFDNNALANNTMSNQGMLTGPATTPVQEEEPQGTFKENMPFGEQLNKLEEKSPFDLSDLGKTTSGSILNAIDKFAGTDLEGTVGNMTPGAMALDASPINRRDSQGQIVGYNPNEFNARDRFKWDMMNNLPKTPVAEAPVSSGALGTKGIFSEEEGKWLANQNQGTPTGPASSVNQGYVGTLPDIPNPTTPEVQPTEEDNVEFPLIQIADEEQPQESNDVKQNIINSVKSKLANVPSNLSSGLNDFIAGYKDNTQTSLSQGDLVNNLTKPKAEPKQLEDGTYALNADETKKGLMTRLGEMVGTGQRIASHPLTQAGIAGLVSKASGGDIDDIAKAMYDYGSKKAEADRYYQMTTGKTDRPFFNTYTADDYKTKIQKDKIDRDQANWQKEFDWKVAKDARDFEVEKEYRKSMAEYYKNGGMRGNTAQRLQAQEERDLRKLRAELIETKRKNELEALKNADNYGEIETGKVDRKGKKKYRPKTYSEAMKEINDKYDAQIEELIYGTSNQSPANVAYEIDEDGFYHY